MNVNTSSSISKYNVLDQYKEAKKVFQDTLGMSDAAFDDFYVKYQEDPKFVSAREKQKDLGAYEFFGKGEEYIPVRGILLTPSPEDILAGNAFRTKYETPNGGTTDLSQNQLRMGVGDSFIMNRGERNESVFTILDNSIDHRWINPLHPGPPGEGDLVFALDALIRYANGQSGGIYLDETRQKEVIKMLEAFGIDTTKEFMINGTKFSVSDGYLHKESSSSAIANMDLLPRSMLAPALQKVIDETYRRYNEGKGEA